MIAHQPLAPLRRDVRIVRVGPDQFRLYDSSRAAHHELRSRERFLLELVGRCTTIDEVRAEFAQHLQKSISAAEVAEFIEQLRVAGLLLSQPTPLPADDDSLPDPTLLPLQLHGEPANVFFDLLTLFFGWIVHPIWLLVIAPVGFVAVGTLAARWSRFVNELLSLRESLPLLALCAATYGAVLLFLNLPLALLAGVCCRQFEGRVRSIGLKLGDWLLPTISFHTDLGDAVVHMTSRGRWTQIALGIVAPLALGAVYIAAWAASSRAHDGFQLWLLLVLPVAVVTAYQLNPFSTQTSAHWALAAWIDDWRLHDRALDETKAWFGGRVSPEPLTSSERRRLRAYGLAHYTLRALADLALLALLGYLLTQVGALGAAILSFLFLWWNRSYLAPIGRALGLDFAASGKSAMGAGTLPSPAP